jgi:hypothetical protein
MIYYHKLPLNNFSTTYICEFHQKPIVLMDKIHVAKYVHDALEYPNLDTPDHPISNFFASVVFPTWRGPPTKTIFRVKSSRICEIR